MRLMLLLCDSTILSLIFGTALVLSDESDVLRHADGPFASALEGAMLSNREYMHTTQSSPRS